MTGSASWICGLSRCPRRGWQRSLPLGMPVWRQSPQAISWHITSASLQTVDAQGGRTTPHRALPALIGVGTRRLRSEGRFCQGGCRPRGSAVSMTTALFFSCGRDLGTSLLSGLAWAKTTYYADKLIPDSGCPQTYCMSHVCASEPAVPNARVMQFGLLFLLIAYLPSTLP